MPWTWRGDRWVWLYYILTIFIICKIWTFAHFTEQTQPIHTLLDHDGGEIEYFHIFDVYTLFPDVLSGSFIADQHHLRKSFASPTHLVWGSGHHQSIIQSVTLPSIPFGPGGWSTSIIDIHMYIKRYLYIYIFVSTPKCWHTVTSLSVQFWVHKPVLKDEAFKRWQHFQHTN